jgi:type I restriction enzyme S subunit
MARLERHREKQAMSNGLGPYPAYKDSGVPWLGDIPEHWKQSPGRACFAEEKTPNVGLQETTVLSLSYGRIVVKPPEKLHGLVPASFETYQIIEPYDIVIRPTDLQNDKVSLRTGLARKRGIITSAYMRLQTKDSLAPEYGHLLLHAYDLKKVFYGLGSGLRQNLSWRDFKYLPCLVPPPDEQAAIARFLDHIDRRTRRYIRAQKKLIALLEERKQALIHRAVTRGLDPDVRLKPTGVEWLGQIPEHWEVKRLKYLVPQVTVGIVIQPAGLYVPSGIPCLRSLNVSTGVIRANDLVYISPDSNEAHSKSKIFRGDILIVRTGQAGTAAIVTDEFDGVNCIDLLVVRKSKSVLSEYLLTYLNSRAAKIDVEYKSVGAIQAHYNTSTLANLVILLPPLDEQRAILAQLNVEVGSIQKAITTAQCQIDLIRECRTRLIADIVTGKLDARQAAAHLPDEPEEPQEWGTDEAEEEGEDRDDAGPEAEDED